VWGRVRRSFESARAQAKASADDADAIRLIVETDVTRFYYTLRSLDAQAQILERTVVAYREQVRLLSVQLRTGLVGPIVVSQAQAQLQTTLALQRDVLRTVPIRSMPWLFSVAVLLRHSRSPSIRWARCRPPPCRPGLPAQLLARRPDVARAEQNLVAANAQIGVATAEFYPRFTLTSSAGFESADIATLFNWQSRVASILPSVSIPIFQGGRLRANLEATKARYGQAVAAYTNQFSSPMATSEDALTDLHALTDIVGSLRQAVSASQDYLRSLRRNTSMAWWTT